MRSVALACALASAVWAQTEPQPVLHEVAFETSLTGPLDWAELELSVTPQSPQAPVAAFVSRRALKPGREGAYHLVGLLPPRAVERPLPRHTQPSWVVDYDQPAFVPVWKAASAAAGPTPDAEALTRFVRTYLDKKSYDHGFDLASQVASHHGGDCTEHAVFLAAVMRKYGIPARAMLGIVLVATNGKPRAFGHMWVEAHLSGEWRVFDAALPSDLSRAYLPAGEMTDEGPGYTAALIREISTLGFRSMVLRSAPKTAP